VLSLFYLISLEAAARALSKAVPWVFQGIASAQEEAPGERSEAKGYELSG
jgi:hypothetical protein